MAIEIVTFMGGPAGGTERQVDSPPEVIEIPVAGGEQTVAKYQRIVGATHKGKQMYRYIDDPYDRRFDTAR